MLIKHAVEQTVEDTIPTERRQCKQLLVPDVCKFSRSLEVSQLLPSSEIDIFRLSTAARALQCSTTPGFLISYPEMPLDEYSRLGEDHTE